MTARVRAQAMAAQPRAEKIRRALVHLNREIATTRGPLRRATLQAELAQLDESQQPAVVQLTPAMLERHHLGMAEKLRSGVSGKVREAIQQSIARILVGVDGSLAIEVKPGGLLGLEGNIAQLGSGQARPLIDLSTLSVAGRQWKLITAR